MSNIPVRSGYGPSVSLGVTTQAAELLVPPGAFVLDGAVCVELHAATIAAPAELSTPIACRRVTLFMCGSLMNTTFITAGSYGTAVAST